MKKNIIFCILFFLGIAVITNPDVEAHRSALKVKTLEYNIKSNPKGGLLAETAFAFGLETFINARVTTNNYLFFSTTAILDDSGNTKTIGIGAFGVVKILIDTDKIK